MASPVDAPQVQYVLVEPDAGNYYAAAALDELAAWFHEQGCGADEWQERCEEAWERATEGEGGGEA